MKKSFGQHLLVDKNHLKKIINAINLKNDDIVLEIGSGTGLLTFELAKQAKKVFAVEYEKSIFKKLKENLKLNNIKNVEIVQSDFLKLDLNKLIDKQVIVVGNIPYNKTSDILLKLFGEIDNRAPYLNYLKYIYLMLQLEVAERIVAKPNTKSYSPLSILVQYFSEPKVLHKVPRNSFYPAPNVDSAFVSFLVREKPQEIKNPTLLKSIIRIGFQQRRKKLINSLNKLFNDKERIIKTFDKLHLDHNLRAENLNIEEYLAISNNI